MSATKDEGVAVFNIFGLSKLKSHITGQATSAILAEVAKAPQSTIHRWLKEGRFNDLARELRSHMPPEFRDDYEKFVSGHIPNVSDFGGLIYSEIKDFWLDFERTLGYFSQFQGIEDFYRQKTGLWTLGQLLDAIQAPLNLSPELPGEDEPLEYRRNKIVTEHRDDLISDAFFIAMASLDIDAARFYFPGYRPTMIFPVVMPEMRDSCIRPYWMSSERKLVDFLFCWIARREEEPTLDDIFEGFTTKDRDRFEGRIKRKTLIWGDIKKLVETWIKYHRTDDNHFDSNDPAIVRQSAFIFVLFVTSKIFSFIFQEVKTHNDEALAIFTKKYYAAWRREIRIRGLVEADGKPWDDLVVAKLIRDSIVWV